MVLAGEETDETRREYETYVDNYMKKLPEMLKTHNLEWTVFGFGDKEPLGFWKDFEGASTAAVHKYGIHKTILVREVSIEYIRFGRNGILICIPTFEIS
jgi:hypothetical protein